MIFKVWVDDTRPMPDDYNIHAQAADDVKTIICWYRRRKNKDYDQILLDLDHDAGDFREQGGDYINILKWLEYMGMVDASYSFRLHTMNPVGRDNMRAIIQSNKWKEIS